MTESPSVTIVVPTRNRSGRLAQCLESLLAQDPPSEPFEIIVADDGSTDETAKKVEEVTRLVRRVVVKYVRCPSRGPNAARNTAVSHSSGDLICFVDDDVVAPRNWLSSIVTAALESKAEVVWGPVSLPPGVRLPGRHPSEIAAYLSESLQPEIPLLCNMAVRREVFRRGLFDPRWTAPVEEIDWLLRTEPSRAFAPAAWLYHNKSQRDCTVTRIFRLAWARGIESGRFDRFRFGRSAGRLVHAAVGVTRSIGHSLATGCVGGLLIAAGRAGYMVGHGLAAPCGSRQAPVGPGLPYA